MQGQPNKIMSFLNTRACKTIVESEKWTFFFFFAKNVCFLIKNNGVHTWNDKWYLSPLQLLSFLEKITHFYFLICHSKHLIIWNNVWTTVLQVSTSYKLVPFLPLLCVFQVQTFKISKEKLLILPRIPWLVAPSCFIHRWRKKGKTVRVAVMAKGGKALTLQAASHSGLLRLLSEQKSMNLPPLWWTCPCMTAERQCKLTAPVALPL